jgi:hypothetical protein
LVKERCEEENHGFEEHSDTCFDGGRMVDHLRDNPTPAGGKHLTEKEKLSCSGRTEKDRGEDQISFI